MPNLQRTAAIPWDHLQDDPRKQDRHASSQNCTLWPVSEGLNDWSIVTAVPTNKNDMDDLDEAHAIVLETAAERNEDTMQVGNIGAFSTEDDCRCHLVEWTIEPHEHEASGLLKTVAGTIKNRQCAFPLHCKPVASTMKMKVTHFCL
jgi:hypothetical protein